MKFMDRLSRLLGRHPDSLKTEPDSPQDQSEHTAVSDMESHAVYDDGASRLKGATGSIDKNFVRPQSPNLDAPQDALRSKKTISSGGASSIDLEFAGSLATECHSLVTNNPRSADNPRAVRASNEVSTEMSESLSWRETEHDTSEFAANLTPSILDADTPAGTISGHNDGIEPNSTEPAKCEQQPEATEKTAVSLVKIECPGCRAIYEVGRELIPPDGRGMQCSNCDHEWFYPLDTFAGMDPSQSSPSAPEHPQESDLASQDWIKLSVDGDLAPIERADGLPLTPSEVRLVISGRRRSPG